MAKLHLDNHLESYKGQEKCADIRDHPGMVNRKNYTHFPCD